MAMWKHVAEVRVTFTFPVDMLRYDACSPDTSEDSAKVERLTRRVDLASAKDSPEAHTVRVKHFGSTKAPPWTVERWKSFGCTIKEVECIKCRT